MGFGDFNRIKLTEINYPFYLASEFIRFSFKTEIEISTKQSASKNKKEGFLEIYDLLLKKFSREINLREVLASYPIDTFFSIASDNTYITTQ